MKFADIPRFVEDGNYQVDLSLDFFTEWIDDKIKNNNLQLNPDFQRGHVWSEEQQISWLEFFIRGGKTGNIIYFNDPYWLNWTENDIGYKDFVCVDGLQRTTAIQKFINNEIPIFGAFYNDFEDKRKMNTKCMIKVNVNTLKTKKEVLQWYIDMNNGGTPHTKDEINRVKEMILKEQ